MRGFLSSVRLDNRVLHDTEVPPRHRPRASACFGSVSIPRTAGAPARRRTRPLSRPALPITRGGVSWLVSGVCLDSGLHQPHRFDRGAVMCHSSPSPLDMLETTFRLLATGPHPLALSGPTVGLRAGPIGLRDLRAMVFHPAASASMQRAVLVELVGRARRHRGAWVVGLVGVLLPGLARPAGRTAGDAGSITDLDATMLAGLLEQLDTPAVPS